MSEICPGESVILSIGNGFVLEKYEFCNNIVSPRTADIRMYNLKQQQQNSNSVYNIIKLHAS